MTEKFPITIRIKLTLKFLLAVVNTFKTKTHCWQR